MQNIYKFVVRAIFLAPKLIQYTFFSIYIWNIFIFYIAVLFIIILSSILYLDSTILFNQLESILFSFFNIVECSGPGEDWGSGPGPAQGHNVPSLHEDLNTRRSQSYIAQTVIPIKYMNEPYISYLLREQRVLDTQNQRVCIPLSEYMTFVLWSNKTEITDLKQIFYRDEIMDLCNNGYSDIRYRDTTVRRIGISDSLRYKIITYYNG